MATSITTRPAVWVAVKNPVVYKFTTTSGPFVNYRIEVEVFKSSDNTSLTGGTKFSFTPNAAGITFVDISSIVKAYLKAEWIKPVALNTVETDTGLEVYIKYQELYDGSATSVIDDVANPVTCVFAAIQVPNTTGNDLDAYVPENDQKKSLRVFTNPKIWRGYPFTLSFLFPGDLTVMVVLIQQMSEAFAILESQVTELVHPAYNTVHRLNPFHTHALHAEAKTVNILLGAFTEILSNPNFDTALTPWSNVAGAGANWTHYGTGANESASVTLGGGLTISDPLRQDFTVRPAGPYILRITPWADYSLGSQDTTITIKGYYLGVLTETFAVYTATLPDGVILAVAVDLSVTATTQFDRIQIVAERTNPADDPRDVHLKTVSLHVSQGIFDTFYSEPLTLDVVDPCENPVMLEWKNSVGGDEWWLFDHNQEASYNYSGSKKAKRMSLSVNNLTTNEWEALNEIFTLGEVYRKNIVEFTALVDKTAVRNDAQVYVVNADGSKTGIIVLPTNNIMFTRQKRHTFHIEIEFPEIQ